MGRTLLHADRSKVVLVMRNLISNALKFTKAAAPSSTKAVRVVVDIQGADPSSVAPSQDMLRIRVTDTGVGIAKVSRVALLAN